MVNLEGLYLSYNKIEKLDADIFNNLNNLKVLSLSNNIISYLYESIFTNLIELKTLDISINNIKKLDKDIFKDLLNLEGLYLSDNKIEKLDKDIFTNLNNLKSLSLSSNIISYLDESIFNNLIELKSLNISSNNIKNLDSDIFKDLIKLKTLNISSNKIKKLDASIFNNLNNLQFVDLDSKICVPSYLLKAKFYIFSYNGRVNICDKLTYKDITDSNYKYEIEYLATQKYVNGYANGTFEPKSKINRYEFVKVLVNSSLLENDILDGCKKSFKDVADNQWFSSYICLAKKHKIIKGYTDNTFKGEKYINFSEALSILFKAYNIELEVESTWNKSYLDKYENLFHSNITLDGNAFLKREEAAKLIYQFDTKKFNLNK